MVTSELRRVSALNSQGVVTRAIFDHRAICNSAALEGDEPAAAAAADACCMGSLARKRRSLGAGYSQSRWADNAKMELDGTRGKG